jgi:ParB family transcriptional regulator, chromosome partitioning protein
MSAPQELEIDLDRIDLGKRLRELNEAEAEKLSHSLNERGLLNPIEVRETQGGRYSLTAGAHRFAAAKILEWQKIRAVIVECSDDEARLREIDENLFRHELTPFDQANFLEERRQIWERVHGTIKRGGDRRSKAQIEPLIDGIGRGSAFIKETAVKFGLPISMVKRALTRKAQIDPKVWNALRSTDRSGTYISVREHRKSRPDGHQNGF